MIVLYGIFLFCCFIGGITLVAMYCREKPDLMVCGVIMVLSAVFLACQLINGSIPHKKGRELLQVTYDNGVPIDSTYIYK